MEGCKRTSNQIVFFPDDEDCQPEEVQTKKHVFMAIHIQVIIVEGLEVLPGSHLADDLNCLLTAPKPQFSKGCPCIGCIAMFTCGT